MTAAGSEPLLVSTGREAPLVSVIVPFHNTARYLPECLDSVLAQSLGNLELVLHDNASNDGSSEIAQERARRDPRIRYHRVDKLLSQVANYNRAITLMSPSSTYCKIVQADDWIYPNCLEQMVACAEQSKTIGLVSSYHLRGKTLSGEGLQHNQRVLPGREIARMHLLTQCFLFGSPTTVMYRSEIARQRQPFFAEGRLNEDTETCYEILREWNFGFVHQILSYTRLDPGSIHGRTLDKDAGILDRLIMLRRYGPEYLSSQEFETRLSEIDRRYYRQLARAALRRRGPDYWAFHVRGLQTQEPALESAKLLKAVGRQLIGVMACPQQLLEITRAWRHKPGDTLEP